MLLILVNMLLSRDLGFTHQKSKELGKQEDKNGVPKCDRVKEELGLTRVKAEGLDQVG